MLEIIIKILVEMLQRMLLQWVVVNYCILSSYYTVCLGFHVLKACSKEYESKTEWVLAQYKST